VNLSPEAVAGHIKKHLDAVYFNIAPEYVATGTSRTVSLEGISVRRPEGFETIDEATISSEASWRRAEGRKQLFSGWKRCLHGFLPFDVYHELTVARCIDRSLDVGWWFRNLPGILIIDTPAGRYSPDFAIFLPAENRFVLLEVKGDIYAEAASSVSSVKKRAAELWCHAVSQASGNRWEYWFLLDSDALHCNNWADLDRRSDKS
jgi:hypothetical protein